MNKNYETLCNNHNELIFLFKQIKKKGTIANEDMNRILEISRTCKVMGQKMENRMRKYKNAIESLGFKRIK